MNAFNYLDVTEYPYLAKGDGAADDTAAIKKAFDDAKTLSDLGHSVTVFIPRGEYMVGRPSPTTTLTFAASGCKLTGGGTLKHKLADDAPYVLRVTGDRNVIEWIRIDGNVAGGASAATNCYLDAGKFNRSRDLQVVDAGSSALAEFGYASTMKRCTAIGGHYGLREGSGDFNILRDCVSLDYRVKGYHQGGRPTWDTLIGCYVESTTNIDNADAYLIDPGSLPRVGWMTLRDCVSNSNHSYAGTTNGAKFGVVESTYVNGCQFLHTEELVTSMRLENQIGRCRVKDTFLSREFHFQHNLGIGGQPPEQVRLERVEIGDGIHLPLESIENARCNVLVVNDSVLRNYSQRGVLWWGADSTYTLISATNCDFNGNLNVSPAPPATSDVLPASGGQINRSRKALWLGNRRINIGLGGQSRFTDPAISSELFGTTRDASARVMEHSAAPTGSVVTWSVGDVVVSTSPTSPGYYGWVCTVVSPLTWKQWGSIA